MKTRRIGESGNFRGKHAKKVIHSWRNLVNYFESSQFLETHKTPAAIEFARVFGPWKKVRVGE